MEQSRIGEIEEILINAFPAVEREIYDGWILNFCVCGLYYYACKLLMDLCHYWGCELIIFC